MGFEKIENLLPSNLKRAGITNQVDTAVALEVIIDVLKNLFPPALVADNVHALHIKHGTLSLAITSPPLAQEIKAQERPIIEAVNEDLGYPLVARLRYLL